jgi:predicted NAD/FAD-binding protein
MRIAIVGSGISGMYAAHKLHPNHDITVFEADSRPGGHTNTVDVEADGKTFSIDTGFIVFNERNYPNFIAMLDELGVASQPSEMSFSFKCELTGLEYNGRSLAALFAQKRNLLRPSFYKMIADIMRFNRNAELLLNMPESVSMGEYLDSSNFSGPMVEDYLLPMAGAIWSSEPGTMREFPARQFGRFFMNHGLMQVKDRPQWRTVSNGSREYLKALCAPFIERIRLNSPVESIERFADHVLIKTAQGDPERFDQVVIAAHSDQALRMLRDPDELETDILGAIPYQHNDTVLHTDASLMPRRTKAWAAWNYHRPVEPESHVSVTYNLTTLQQVPTNTQFLVTLNGSKIIDPDKIIQRISYEHPVFNLQSMAAQQRWSEINGIRRTWYCGAYWGYGFHEDGVKSAIRVLEGMESLDSHEELHLSRTG